MIISSQSRLPLRLPDVTSPMLAGLRTRIWTFCEFVSWGIYCRVTYVEYKVVRFLSTSNDAVHMHRTWTGEAWMVLHGAQSSNVQYSVFRHYQYQTKHGIFVYDGEVWVQVSRLTSTSRLIHPVHLIHLVHLVHLVRIPVYDKGVLYCTFVLVPDSSTPLTVPRSMHACMHVPMIGTKYQVPTHGSALQLPCTPPPPPPL